MTLAEEVKEKIQGLWIDSEAIEDEYILLEITKNEYIEIIENTESLKTIYRLTWAMPKEAATKCIERCDEICEVAFDGAPHEIYKTQSLPADKENDLWHIVIAKFDNKNDIDADSIYSKIKDFVRKRCIEIDNRPEGVEEPVKRNKSTTEYEREIKVKEWVLKNAKGICESCGNEGPFIDDSKRLYLEVHHVVLLANGGPDAVENTVAVCPNCHRALHHARNKKELKEKLIRNLSRLNISVSAK